MCQVLEYIMSYLYYHIGALRNPRADMDAVARSNGGLLGLCGAQPEHQYTMALI